jgi:hypothetical protein
VVLSVCFLGRVARLLRCIRDWHCLETLKNFNEFESSSAPLLSIPEILIISNKALNLKIVIVSHSEEKDEDLDGSTCSGLLENPKSAIIWNFLRRPDHSFNYPGEFGR